MADSDARRLEQMRVAAHPLRFRLLAYACSTGGFTASEAAAIAGAPTTSGNARSTHANRLRKAGLLAKNKNPVTFHVTAAGRRVYAALAGTLSKPPPEEQAAVALLALVQGASVDDLLGAQDLVAALRDGLNTATATQRAVYRLERVEP